MAFGTDGLPTVPGAPNGGELSGTRARLKGTQCPETQAGAAASAAKRCPLQRVFVGAARRGTSLVSTRPRSSGAQRPTNDLALSGEAPGSRVEDELTVTV